MNKQIQIEKQNIELPAWCQRFDDRSVTPPSESIGFIAVPTITEDQKARVKKALSAAQAAFMEKLAHEYFGQYLPRYRALAEVLSQMSEDAQAKRFDKLMGQAGSIQDVWDLYTRTYETIGKLWIPRFAPNALTPDEFVDECSNEEVIGSMPKITCPCCNGERFDDNDAFPPYIDEKSLRTSLWCLGCGFPLDVQINFVEPESDEESLTRSYIRSLLDFENYDKAHGLGPIHDSRTVAQVAEQAAKALVHLPDSFSTDYQQLVLEEMQR